MRGGYQSGPPARADGVHQCSLEVREKWEGKYTARRHGFLIETIRKFERKSRECERSTEPIVRFRVKGVSQQRK